MKPVSASAGLPQVLVALLLAAILAACDEDQNAAPEGTVFYGDPSGPPVRFTLAGTVRYEDRLYGEVAPGNYGFTGATRFNPVAYAVLDLVSETGAILHTTRTGPDGRFSATLNAGGLLRLRILARTDRISGRQVEVKSAAGELYAVTRYFVPAAGELVLDTDIPASSIAGAFNILDLYGTAAEFVRERTGRYPPARLTAFWSRGSADGTYFTANSVHVLGGTAAGDGDTDEYDDDVLLHEYGHFIESFSDNADSPGGFHILNDNTQDVRLAWSEGFASYISGAVKRWLHQQRSPVLSDTTLTMEGTGPGPIYLDTNGNGELLHWFFDIDYATVPSFDQSSSYATAETSVAKVLWNLTTLSGFETLWHAYDAFPAKAARTRPVSIETYWDNWQASHRDDDPYAAFLERRVNYAHDSFETDDHAATAVALTVDQEPAALDRHTLYSTAADNDFFTVRLTGGKSYVIETFGLLNGADTLLAVLSPNDLDRPLSLCGASGTGNCQNDNASLISYATPAPDPDRNHRLKLNDGCKLASRLTMKPSATGIYLVRVSAATAPSRGAGRYGSYLLKIGQSPTSPRCP